MDTVPKRSIIASPYRFVLSKGEKYLWFPFKNPDVYTVTSVILSTGFLFISNIPSRLVLLIVILLLDWMDGAAARRFKGPSKKGYIVDVTFDRISDGIITASIIGTVYGNILFFLYLMNNLLSLMAIRTNKSYLLAIRFFYLVILIFQMFFPGVI